jgi:hypothetical protein
MVTPFRKIPLVCVFALVAYLSLFYGSFDRIADDPGLGWHLANGSVIANSGTIPRVDPFLATPIVANPYAKTGEARPWINEQWLGDIVLFELLSLGGWPLVYGVVVGLYLIAYFGIAADSLLRSREGGLLVLLGVVLAFKLGQVHLIVRPVLFSLVFFSLIVARSRSFIARESWTGGGLVRESIIMGGLVALWANIHPAFIYSFVVLGVAMLARLIAGADRRAHVVPLAILLGVCVLASSLNPFGFRLYESITHLGGSAALRGVTREWAPVDLRSTEGTLLLALALIPCISALVSSRIRRGVGLFDVLLVLIFVSQALLAVRVVPFASLACLPLWAACFGGVRFLPERSWAGLTRRILQRIDERESSFVAPGMVSATIIAVCGIVVMILAPASVLPRPLGSVYERRLSSMFAPADVRKEQIILGSPDWGGAITHLMWPHSRAVLDDRTVIVGAALYQAYGESVRDPSAFHQLAGIFGVTDVLVPGQSILAGYLLERDEWRRSGESGDTLRFTKR